MEMNSQYGQKQRNPLIHNFPTLPQKGVLLLCLTVFLFMNCTGMDNETIPSDQYEEVKINAFEVNLERQYIRGEIQNLSEYDITTSIFRLVLYGAERKPEGRGIHVSIVQHAGPEVIDLPPRLFSQDFVVRERLKPGYSTEFYFELKMDYEGMDILYTHEIIGLKGNRIN